MIAAPAYIAACFFQRFAGFFTHWYVDGTRSFWIYTAGILKKISVLAKKSFFGNAKGVFERFFRLSLAGILYLAVPILSLVLYLTWILFPLYTLLKVAKGLIL